MTARTLRPSPDRIIEARRAPERDTRAAEDKRLWSILAAVLIALALAFIVSNAIARAFVRPEPCRALPAAECAAAIEERMQK